MQTTSALKSLSGLLARWSSNAVRVGTFVMLAAAAAWGTNAFAQTSFTSVIAFGDSLSDNGNYYRLVDQLKPLVPQDGSPPPPYFFGRFSNGPVAVELLAQQLGVALEDHAVGGALSGEGNEDPRFMGSGMKAQVEAMTHQRGVLDGHALYLVWGGANDLLALLNPQATVASNIVIGNAIENIGESVELLYARGARHFLLPNMPDLGLTPLARTNQVSTQATLLASSFNAAYSGALAKLAHKLPQAVIHTVDVAKFENAVYATPSAYGLLNATDSCIADPTHLCILTSFNGGPAGGYLYWDDVHPTALGHAWLARQFAAALTP